MKSLITSGLIALGLTGCGASNGIDAQIFEAVEASDAAKLSKPAPGSKPLEFEGLSLKQKCWAFESDDGSYISSTAFMKLGMAITQIEGIKLDIIELKEDGHTLRQITEKGCANYVLINIEDKTSPPSSLLNKMEFGIAVTKKAHCGELSKTYSEMTPA